jgi:hypothetical protein
MNQRIRCVSLSKRAFAQICYSFLQHLEKKYIKPGLLWLDQIAGVVLPQGMRACCGSYQPQHGAPRQASFPTVSVDRAPSTCEAKNLCS